MVWEESRLTEQQKKRLASYKHVEIMKTELGHPNKFLYITWKGSSGTRYCSCYHPDGYLAYQKEISC